METNAPNTILDMNTTQLSVQQSVMVAPYTNYTATVVAFTNAGNGNSMMEVALSPEAGNVDQDSRFCTFVSGRTAVLHALCCQGDRTLGVCAMVKRLHAGRGNCSVDTYCVIKELL